MPDDVSGRAARALEYAESQAAVPRHLLGWLRGWVAWLVTFRRGLYNEMLMGYMNIYDIWDLIKDLSTKYEMIWNYIGLILGIVGYFTFFGGLMLLLNPCLGKAAHGLGMAWVDFPQKGTPSLHYHRVNKLIYILHSISKFDMF